MITLDWSPVVVTSFTDWYKLSYWDLSRTCLNLQTPIMTPEVPSLVWSMTRLCNTICKHSDTEMADKRTFWKSGESCVCCPLWVIKPSFIRPVFLFELYPGNYSFASWGIVKVAHSWNRPNAACLLAFLWERNKPWHSYCIGISMCILKWGVFQSIIHISLPMNTHWIPINLIELGFYLAFLRPQAPLPSCQGKTLVVLG